MNPNALSLPDLFDHLTANGSLTRLLDAARHEDLGTAGDVTTAAILDGARTVRAAAVGREAGIACGVRLAPRVIEVFGGAVRVEPAVDDGTAFGAGTTLLHLEGELGTILAAERTLLNLLGRLGGIATLASRYVRAVAGTGSVICDTRKTTPGLRALEKYAVRCGGGTLHRLGLHDAVLLKDNHLAHLETAQLARAVTRAAQSARAAHELRFVEVEVDALEQLEALLTCPPGTVDIVLLDNMAPDELHRAVALRDAAAPSIRLEASGGVDLTTVRSVAESGVDRISVGALTHGACSLDVGLDLPA